MVGSWVDGLQCLYHPSCLNQAILGITNQLSYILKCIHFRDGEYGGPLMLYNTDMSHLVILSPLNNFMVSSMVHNKEEQSLQWGLMGSIKVSIIQDYYIESVMYLYISCCRKYLNRRQ